MACGERVGLVTRAAADQIDPGAAHSPPSVPHSPDPRAHAPCRGLFIILMDRIPDLLTWALHAGACDVLAIAEQRCGVLEQLERRELPHALALPPETG